ncbi:hypothetical protein [Streptomyces lydicus]|uniref:hypothetical protein n=1 Tax=Streptomyces lydicus TaxID=47763 RepID=UPI00378EDB66
MKLKLLEPVVPAGDLESAAYLLAWDEVKAKYRSAIEREVHASIELSRAGFVVYFTQLGAVDASFSVSLNREVVEACARARMEADREIEHPTGVGLLRLTTLLLPGSERADWLEEQRGYLADLPKRRACWGWIIAQLLAMPRYAYTVRTGRERESA